MNLFSVEQPKNGSRLVAFFDDASGARLFIRDDAGRYIDAFGEEDDMSGYSHWMPIPDTYKFWFENIEEPRP